MAFDFAADTDSMILAGTVEAYTTSAGNPTGAQFLYGTAYLGNSTYGIITSCNLKTLSDKSNIKGSGGVAIAHALIDPGMGGTVSVLFPKSVGLPQLGAGIGLNVPNKTAGSADVSTQFFIMDFAIKWEREGWRMLDIEIERRDAMWNSGSDWYAYNIEQDGTLGALIDSN